MISADFKIYVVLLDNTYCVTCNGIFIPDAYSIEALNTVLAESVFWKSYIKLQVETVIVKLN